MSFDDILDTQPTKDEFEADETIDKLEKEADEAIDEAMDIIVNGDDEDKVDAAKNLVDTARDLLEKDDTIDEAERESVEKLLDMYEDIIDKIKEGK